MGSISYTQTRNRKPRGFSRKSGVGRSSHAAWGSGVIQHHFGRSIFMPSTVGLREEKAELEAVFASGIFSRAPGLAHMLNYVCTKYFEGQSDQVKEYNIAVEALGRPADFDQKRDSIVRVEAHRLRKRLSEYYEGEGASHRIRIVLPSGQYVPQFQLAEPPPQQAIEAGTEIA